MFDKLRRAKSFIQRSKCEEERQKRDDLNLNETSHLRRNVSINSEVLKRQNELNIEVKRPKKTALRRQVSRSNENLHDQVLEQLRNLNFGDSYSKKDAQKLSRVAEEHSGFERRNPVYMSERNYRRKSFGAEEKTKKAWRNEKCLQHRNSGDVLSNFNGPNNAYRSGADVSVKGIVQNVNGVVSEDNHPAYRSAVNDTRVPERNGVDGRGGLRKQVPASGLANKTERSNVKEYSSNFERRNPAYWSERNVQLIRQLCSEQISGSGTQMFSKNDDFLLNRKSVDLSYNFDRRNPAYVSDRAPRKPKPDLLEKSGLKSLFDKVKGATQKHSQDSSDNSSFSGCSTSSSTSSSFERRHPASRSERCLAQKKTSEVGGKEEQSRKRHHNLTKASNFDGNSSFESVLVEERRKKTFDRLKQDGDKRDTK